MNIHQWSQYGQDVADGKLTITEARVALGTASLGEWLGYRWPRLFKSQAKRNAASDRIDEDLRRMAAETERRYNEVVAEVKARRGQNN
jgi:hypothetical protein